MTYTEDSPAEITLGICDNCDNYVPFIRIPKGNRRVYECLTCHHKFEQKVNGKVVFKKLDETYRMVDA